MIDRLLNLRKDLLQRTAITEKELASGHRGSPDPSSDELLEKYGIPLIEIFYDHTRPCQYGGPLKSKDFASRPEHIKFQNQQEFHLTNLRYCKFLDLSPEQLAIQADALTPTGEPGLLRAELKTIFGELGYEPKEK